MRKINRKDAWLIGRKVSKLRKERKLTQEIVACASGLTRQAVGHIECGYVYPERIKLSKICYALGVSLIDVDHTISLS
jgi:transcriptional regulator with XRE-family HTH domain